MPRRAPTRAPLRLFATLPSIVLAATLLLPSRAPAKATIQATGTVAAGWSDNITNAPDEPTAGIAREGDFFFQLAPGAVVSSAAPRFIQRLAYTLTADIFVTHASANAYANTLDWAADVAASRTTDIIFTLRSQQGRLGTFNLTGASSSATVGLLPNSNINYFSQAAGEDLASQPSRHWLVRQTLAFNAFIPIDRGQVPDSYTLAVELGGDRIFRIDALGLIWRNEFIDYVAARDANDVPIGNGDQQQYLTGLTARWRRDWSPFWSSEAALGVVSVIGETRDPVTGQLATQHDVEPSALAALRWTREAAAAELRYAHDVVPNPLIGNTFSSDEVAVQASVPFLRAKMFLSATAAYQYARVLALTEGAATGHAHLAIVDFTVGWQPRPEIGVFARYSFFDQFGQPSTQTMVATLPDLTRSTVLVGVNVIYPARAAARVPTRQGLRVDRADQAGFPEVEAHEQQLQHQP